MQKSISQVKGERLLRCSALLGRRRMGTKSCDDRLRPPLRTVNNTESKLGKMKPYPGVVAVVVDALKKKGMRFKEVSFENGDIAYDNKNVVVFRGDAAKVLHCALHSRPSGVPAHQPLHDVSLLVNGLGCPTRRKHRNVLKIVRAIHKRSLPNESSSATATTNAAKAGQNKKDENAK